MEEKILKAMTLKQYAEAEGITYEAVRQQVQRNKAALGVHLFTRKGVKYLDETAVEYLRSRRRESPISVQRIDKEEELEEALAKVEELTAKLQAAQELVMKLQADAMAGKDRIIALQDEVRLSLQARVDYDQVKEERDQLRQEATEARENAERIQAEADTQKAADQEEIRRYQGELEQLQNDLEKFRPAWFGFYRKV